MAGSGQAHSLYKLTLLLLCTWSQGFEELGSAEQSTETEKEELLPGHLVAATLSFTFIALRSEGLRN